MYFCKVNSISGNSYATSITSSGVFPNQQYFDFDALHNRYEVVLRV